VERPAIEVTASAAPRIPFDTDRAFFPLHKDLDGVFYSWDECTRRILVCVKWEYREVKIPFSNAEMMRWFHAQGFGLKKLERP
jgi:hypothetical protein